MSIGVRTIAKTVRILERNHPKEQSETGGPYPEDASYEEEEKRIRAVVRLEFTYHKGECKGIESLSPETCVDPLILGIRKGLQRKL